MVKLTIEFAFKNKLTFNLINGQKWGWFLVLWISDKFFGEELVCLMDGLHVKFVQGWESKIFIFNINSKTSAGMLFHSFLESIVKDFFHLKSISRKNLCSMNILKFPHCEQIISLCRKLRIFLLPQILREIKYGNYRSWKIANFWHFGGPKIWFLRKFHIWKLKIPKIAIFWASKRSKLQFCRP